MGYTFLFPGQGSQKVGMAADLYQAEAGVKARFEQANTLLGRDLGKIILEGPEAELTITSNTQPALFTVESAMADLLMEKKGIRPDYTMGHSLGEYSALYAAGVFSFADGLRIVAKRGELMAAAGQKTPGAMSAVMGLTTDAIRKVLATLNVGVVVPANENSPDQTVISGNPDAVKAAGEALSAAGAKRVIALAVSGAFHSPLMQPVAEDFAAFIETIEFKVPRCPVVTNVTASAVSDPLELKKLLVKQLVSPVRWVDSVACLTTLGVTAAIEIGPGAVLKGLIRKCSETINVISCATADNLYSIN